MSDQHRGAAPSSPFVHRPDSRVSEMDTALRGIEATVNRWGSSAFGPIRDAHRTLVDLSTPGEMLCRGVVIHPIAALGWYKVQVAGVGTISCIATSPGSLLPMGPRDLGAYGPNTIVYVFKPTKAPFGVIMGAEPPQTLDGQLPNPDFLFQGGQSGYKREDVHKHPMKNAYRGGYIANNAGQRPFDGTSMERGWITGTGLAISIDDYFAQIRVNEMCGLFLSYFDGWARLAGQQLDIESLIHAESARDDEGEARYTRGIATYPWEALGLYDSGTEFTQTNSNDDITKKPVGKLDLGDDDTDLQPFYRYQEWGGYLGQGHHRLVACPPKSSGKRKMDDQDVDEGLFAETIGLDGDYTLRSAKSLYIGKRCKIVVPREIKAPEDGFGDDAQSDNYKFSGKHGGGDEHKIEPVKVEGDLPSMRKIAGVMDLIAHAVNWKALHPFHYHKADFRTKQEAEQSTNFTRVQENLNFASLANEPFLPEPTAKKIKIDHRYNDVEYFERESFLYFADDGSVILAAGGGAAIVLNEFVRVEAPSDVILAPGRDMISLADQTILRSRGSVDISSSTKDVRLKAEKNLQMLAGNGGAGALLLESKSRGRTQQFKKKVGEDVIGSGIIVKSAGVLGLYGDDVYVRCGARGDVILDGDKGRRSVIVKTRDFNVFCQREAAFYYGPVDDSSNVTKTYRFGATRFLVDTKLFVGGRITSYSGGGGLGGLTADGRISCTGGISAGGRLSDRKGGMIGKTPDGVTAAISAAVSAAAALAQTTNNQGQSRHEALVSRFYKPQQPGDATTIGEMSFSFRDDKSERQYGVSQFKWLERRWEQMVRFGLASGGSPWIEKPVSYQGEQLYPWPGRRKWTQGSAFHRLKELTMFDAAQGVSKDRPYDEPELADWDKTTMASGHKLIRSS